MSKDAKSKFFVYIDWSINQCFVYISGVNQYLPLTKTSEEIVHSEGQF